MKKHGEKALVKMIKSLVVCMACKKASEWGPIIVNDEDKI